jgi:Ni,Fe-hydrogenase III large subunit
MTGDHAMTRLAIRSGAPFALGRVPVLDAKAGRAAALAARDAGERIVAMFGCDRPGERAVRVFLVTADDAAGALRVVAFDVQRAAGAYASLTRDWTEAHMFEREIAEQFGVVADGHPWLKPVRGEPPLAGPDLFAPDPGAKTRLDAYPFLRAESEEMHEVGVGPVHAGIIEPGHFRFLCHGETVFHLEISLGYQHRGVERRLLAGPDRRSLVTMESIAGDTVIGHGYAYCRAVEGLSATTTTARAAAIRCVALELERCSNHVGDLGALANDVGYLPGAAWFGRLRGEFLNMLMDLSGNRYGRGLLTAGGVRFDLPAAMAKDFTARLARAKEDFENIAELLFRKPSVMARFDGTGRVAREDAEMLGMVGPAARASGCSRDVRHDFAHGAYRFVHLPVALGETGDVAARALVRRVETERAIEFLIEQIGSLPPGALAAPLRPTPPDTACVALVEGWRGEIAHVALTGADSRLARYKVVDPSFHNWTGLALALRGQEISDFPLCNKSFNLSYAGHDL